ncbi:hypothetical protein PED39_04610 [Methanomassiliicoccales archaeon LGM-RCC1]|nr:hypothetical protein PED39_04610 [Methanomassiliicoccales archaeon LGM-RCC1]
MNTKTTKFLAVLAVLAMAFAVIAPAEQDDAASIVIDDLTPITDGATLDSTSGYYYANSNVKVKIDATSIDEAGWAAIKSGTYTDAVKIIILKGCTVEIENIGTATNENPAISAWVALTEEAGTTSGTKKVTTYADASDRNLWFDVGDKSTLQTVQVGSDWRIYLGPTSSELNIDSSAVGVTGDWKTCPINLKTDTDSVLIAINLTAEIHSETTDGTTFKVTKFSGEISYVDSTTLSIDKWTSGDIEVVKSVDSTLNSDISTGSTLYIDSGATITASTEFTNNGTINIKQTKDSTGVAEVGIFTLNVNMVNNGVINNLGKFDQDGNITNEGKITTGEDGVKVTWAPTSGEVINNGTFTFKETIAGSGVVFSSESTGEVRNQAASNKDVSGVLTSDTYGWNQSATIIASSTLTGRLTLDGLLTINEGVTLTITGSGEIVLDSPQSVIVNNGTIVIQNNMGIDNQKGFIYNYGKMTLSDPSTSVSQDSPTLALGVTIETINYAAFVKNYGTITNSVGYVAVNEKGSFMNQSGASFISNSFLYLGDGALISNAGKIQIDGTVDASGADQAIALTDKDATVQIVGLILPDGGLTITNKTGVDGAVGSVVLATTKYSDHTDLITGLNVATYDKGKALIVSGNVSLYSDTYGQTVSESYTITLKGTTAYIGDLTLQEKVLLAGENKTFKVVGTLVAANPGSAAIQDMDATGTITVDGKIITNVSPLSGYKNLNAAMYQTISESFIKTYYYTTLPNAVAEASDLGVAEVTIYGSLEVKSDLTIPAPLIVKNQGILTIKDGANVTVADGAELNNGGTINVDGSLYAYKIEDISGNTTSIAIVSDVKVVGSEDVLYTNLYSALETAEAGDTVVITKDDGSAVKLSKDTTIPVGVTLDTNEKALDTNGKKLIVNGTLALYAAGSFTSYEDVTLNGYIVSDDQRTYSTTGLAGAYYSTDVGSVDRYYIAGIKNLADITASGVTEIEVRGEISTAAIAFSGAEETVTVTFYDNVDVTTMTATKAVVVFNSGSTVKSTVTDGDNSVALVGDVPTAKTLEVTLGDKFKVGGDFNAVTTEASKYVFTLSGASTIDALNVYNLRVDGTATTAGAVVIVNDLVVTGSLTVAEGKTLTAKNAMVTGSIDAIGAATITNVTIGSTSNAVKAVADVSGKVTATVVVLFAGNTVDSEIIEDMKFTEFYVDGKLWFTVYSNGLVELNDLTVPVTDAIAHPGHYDDLIVGEDGKLSGTLTPGDKASCDLAVDYEIYNVTIITDAGIKAVYINGKVMASPPSGLNDFTLLGIEAGTYKVTYTLLNGYEGSAQLYTADGTILEDNSFVLSGTDADDLNVTFQLIGTEKEVPSGPTPEEQSEWTVTTILLLILVILIAIMAVIVALRLNRS